MALSSFLLFFLLSAAAAAAAATLNSDVTILLQAKLLLGSADNLILSTWSSNSSLCSWRNIRWVGRDGSPLDCSSSVHNLSLAQDPAIAAYAIDLAAVGLNGTIPSQLSKLSSLHSLDLNTNNLTGSIPFDLGNSPALALLYLSHNRLTGAIPPSLWNLCPQLVELDLDHNQLAGSIPSPAQPNPQCPHLHTLDLSNNILSGSIPSFLGSFSNVSKLNLSFNNLTGAIPLFTNTVSENDFAGNPLLCGKPLSNPCSTSSALPQHKGLSPKVVAALVIGLLAAAVILLALLIAFGHKHNWGRNDAEAVASLREELQEEDVGDGKLFRFEGGEHLTVEEVLNAPGEVLGKTSYGTVYKAKLNNGGKIALRLLREDIIKDRQSFASAIQELGLIRHPNLVSVLAYYAGPKGERLLVYDYLSRGSLSDLIHDKSPLRPPLGWGRRHKIVLGAARGLAHLHHGLHSLMVHGNLKSKNIIVDENYEGHLADYSLNRLMNQAAQNEMVNFATSQGYRAPELKKLSRANAKSDIYSFGIVLLEVLTGKRPSASEGGSSNQDDDLPTMVKAAVLEERTSELFDLEIMASMRSPVEDGLLQTLQLAMGCCSPIPEVRPDIKEVIKQLEEIRPKIPTPLYTPTGLKSPRDFIL